MASTGSHTPIGGEVDTQTPTTTGVVSKYVSPFALRPRRANYQQQGGQNTTVRLQTNSFRLINLNPNGQKEIQKYSVKFDPEIPDTSKIDFKVEKVVREQIKVHLKTYFLVSKSIYSYTLLKDDQTFKGEYDGVTYTVTLTWSKSINSGDIELYSFYSLFFKQLMKKMEFERLGRSCFNPKASVKMNQYNLEIWPGFYSSM